ncbi:hypothetical protein O159_21640 [Leifsonia xyli subsp. cynodontis DSM 46306]|uniref:Asparagine synthetase domain-containing protein n=1 Tax=Leifsonia xyli subsp. cynodontis DSM 46306 TaxID=1389489 RepID=U3PBM5_LEIXC|nr:hypothetical protein O159_21640 [Leifsonia xyli subsp. cynodontis DSM 46306]
MNSLRFRRQFLITPDSTVDLDGWGRHRVAEHTVYAHPELSVTIHRAPGSSFVLLGFAIDPERPEQDDAAVLAEFAEAWSRSEGETFLHRLSGRFALFAFTGDDIVVYLDATGTRSVEYTWHEGRFHAASQAYLLAEVVPLRRGERARQFDGSVHKAADREHFLPAAMTLYDEVDRLVPNHRLNVARRRQERVWPVAPLPDRTLTAAEEFTAAHLTAAIGAASRRFPLSLPLTAGYDSRALIAAASRDVRSSMYRYTLLYRHLTRFSTDVAIAKTVAARLGVAHHLIDCRAEPDPGWRELYTGNTPMAHYDDWGVIAHGILNGHPADHVAVKGNASEVARTFYGGPDGPPATGSAADILALIPGWAEIPFIAASIEEWHRSAAPASAASGIALDDLFYWEHRCGSWQGQSQLEWDIAQVDVHAVQQPSPPGGRSWAFRPPNARTTGTRSCGRSSAPRTQRLSACPSTPAPRTAARWSSASNCVTAREESSAGSAHGDRRVTPGRPPRTARPRGRPRPVSPRSPPPPSASGRQRGTGVRR